MRTYTLDTNLLIDLEEDWPAARALRRLIAAFGKGEVDLAIPAIMASENQKGGQQLQNFSEFQQRLDRSELRDVTLIKPMAYSDVCFFDFSVFPDAAMIELERNIHEVVHPEAELTMSEASAPKEWRNAKCDVQAMWSHIYNRRDCYVTRDTDFLRKVPALVELGAGAILDPGQAIAELTKERNKGTSIV